MAEGPCPLALEHLPNRSAVTLLAVSEFGRRLRENGSRGTEYGSTLVALLFGEQLPSCLIGATPPSALWMSAAT